MRMRIGINGFGRIGRAIARINLERDVFDLVAVNDINPDIGNVAYLLKYDSTYGRLARDVRVEGPDTLAVERAPSIRVSRHHEIDAVPWKADAVDLVIDASGIEHNLPALRRLADQGVRHCVVTNAPDEQFVDRFVIFGVNETDIRRGDFVLSASICDAAAFAPVALLLERHFGIEYGSLTTLHPWLSYQRLLDGPSFSFSDPGSIHSAYALGRASTLSLIPKTTSCLRASAKVLPGIDRKFVSLSYRVPTTIVSSADLTVKLSRDASRDDVIGVFEAAERTQAYPVIANNYQALVSVDFAGVEHSAVVDHRWTMVHGDAQLKLVLWYDNEWGYGSRVVDIVSRLARLDAE
ncbi:MAG TPA: glyceraldehyde 3-phosphate dehydrogenase NAD-binding domain-containing protein [bacterium]|nr:glyceraldehyde 3-phosphate dehydrogenase NAD-binding domain-containing protein [bacterium]